MPSLVTCFRTWSIGDDDFVISGVVHTIIRFALLIAFSVSYHGYSNVVINCENNIIGDSDTTQTIFKLSIVILLFSFLSNALVTFISSRGTILDQRPRSSLPFFLIIRGIFITLEFIISVIGIILLNDYNVNCSEKPTDFFQIAYGVYLTSIIIFSISAISMCCFFEFAGGQGNGDWDSHLNWRQQSSNTHSHLTNYDYLWLRRLKVLFCCASAHITVYEEIGRQFSLHFKNLDIVPSDIAAALILVRKEQLMIEKEQTILRSESIIPNETIQNENKALKSRVIEIIKYQRTQRAKSFDFSDPDDVDTLNTVIRLFNFTLAIYGWPLLMLMNPVTGICKLCTKCHLPSGNGDNCCHCNTSAAHLTVYQNNDVEILYQSFENTFEMKPYLVGVDHHLKTIIVSVRGTLSIDDCVTDVLAETIETDIKPLNNSYTKTLAHKGIYTAAQAIAKHIQQKQIVSNAVSIYKDYKLVISGHSLGAGVSVLLSFILKEIKLFSHLTCIAYSPPPVVNIEAAIAAENFILAVATGKDVVPRLSIKSAYELRDKMLELTARSHVSKTRIFCAGCCCGSCFGQDLNSFVSPSIDSEGNNDVASKKFQEFVRKAQVDLPEWSAKHRPLSLAGKILHVSKTHYSVKHRFIPGLKSKKIEYHATWADREDFNHILISPSMILDHLPDRLIFFLRQAQKNLVRKDNQVLPNSYRRSSDKLDSTL